MGIEPERVKLVWASAAEGVHLAQEIAKLTEEIRALGPLNWPNWQGDFKTAFPIPDEKLEEVAV